MLSNKKPLINHHPRVNCLKNNQNGKIIVPIIKTVKTDKCKTIIKNDSLAPE